MAVLHGEGGVFCSGADLTAVAGYAVAGGLELALWCDLRIAASVLDQEGLDETAALVAEFAHGQAALRAEAASGAARFAAGAGRHGSFGSLGAQAAEGGQDAGL